MPWYLLFAPIPALIVLLPLALDFRTHARFKKGARFWIREWPHIVLEVCDFTGEVATYGQVVNGVGQPNYRTHYEALKWHIGGWLRSA